MLTLNTRTTAARAAVTAGVLALVLTGCGGGDTVAPAASAATSPVTAPTGSPGAGGQGAGGQGGRGFGGVDFQAVQACLKAAGISLPTPTGSFTRGPRPSGSAGGPPPSGGPRPSGGFRGPGGGGGMFRDPQVQAALKACGITLPTGRPGAPTATPTS